MTVPFTMGPWRAEAADMFGDHNILHPADSAAVAAVVSNLRDPEEVAANAHLIAAAPDLYETAAALLDRLDRSHFPSPAARPSASVKWQDACAKADALRAALARARGEA